MSFLTLDESYIVSIEAQQRRRAIPKLRIPRLIYTQLISFESGDHGSAVATTLQSLIGDLSKF